MVTLLALTFAGAQAQFTQASLQATGLTCALCSNAINKALQKLDFVESVLADIKNSSFSIRFREGKTVNIDAIREAVEGAGFSIGGLKMKGRFNGVKIEKDHHLSIGNAYYLFLNANGQTLNGEQEITVVDRNFVSDKQFKKIAAGSRMPCVQTGKAGPDCAGDGLKNGERVYHVTI